MCLSTLEFLKERACDLCVFYFYFLTNVACVAEVLVLLFRKGKVVANEIRLKIFNNYSRSDIQIQELTTYIKNIYSISDILRCVNFFFY